MKYICSTFGRGGGGGMFEIERTQSILNVMSGTFKHPCKKIPIRDLYISSTHWLNTQKLMILYEQTLISSFAAALSA